MPSILLFPKCPRPVTDEGGLLEQPSFQFEVMTVVFPIKLVRAERVRPLWTDQPLLPLSHDYRSNTRTDTGHMNDAATTLSENGKTLTHPLCAS
jgi:hypothetical protein